MSVEFTVGRDDAKRADIMLSGSHISGIHAKLMVDDRGFLWIKDLKSTNGTWVTSSDHKKTVGESYVQVHSGEILSLGGVEYSAEHLFSLLPPEPPSPKKTDASTVVMRRCLHCGTPTPAGQPCIKCKR